MKQEQLERFVDAQKSTYHGALSEVLRGHKSGHWMWFVFPQIDGLGYSETAKFYAIKDKNEAQAYLAHPVLGKRLHEISSALLKLENNDANSIFGSPDDMKLKSSMTLFSSLNNSDPVFDLVLNKFYKGEKDEKTLRLLGTSLG
jgi:uncharacterized protein (DUF1810 family)